MSEKSDQEYSILSDEADRLYKDGDYDSAFRKYLELGDKGYEEVEVFLGWMYLSGKGTATSFEEAKKWFEKAAERGDPEGQRYLARLSASSGDYEDALKWFEKLASGGDAHAQWYLGRMALKKNQFQTAIGWFEKSAKQGYAPGLYRLASHYYYGRGVTKDKRRAFTLFEKAANKGNVKAQAEYAKRLIMGYDGIGKIWEGFVLLFKVPANILKIDRKNPDDERLVW